MDVLLCPDRMWTMDWMKPSQGKLLPTVCWTRDFCHLRKEMSFLGLALNHKLWASCQFWWEELTGVDKCTGDDCQLSVTFQFCDNFHTRVETWKTRCHLLCLSAAVVTKSGLFFSQNPWVWARPSGAPLGSVKDRWEQRELLCCKWTFSGSALNLSAPLLECFSFWIPESDLMEQVRLLSLWERERTDWVSLALVLSTSSWNSNIIWTALSPQWSTRNVEPSEAF